MNENKIVQNKPTTLYFNYLFKNLKTGLSYNDWYQNNFLLSLKTNQEDIQN